MTHVQCIADSLNVLSVIITLPTDLIEIESWNSKPNQIILSEKIRLNNMAVSMGQNYSGLVMKTEGWVWKFD